MKTQLRLILTAAIIAIGQILALPALAAEGKIGERGYIGGGLVYHIIDMSDLTCTSGLSCNNAHFGGKLHGGYMVNDNFGFEGGYHFASGTLFEGRGSVGDGSREIFIDGDIDFSINAPYVAGVFRAPISDYFVLAGKVGIAKWDLDVTARDRGGRTVTAFDSGTEVIFGGGLEYDIGDLAFHIQFMRHADKLYAGEWTLIYRL